LKRDTLRSKEGVIFDGVLRWGKAKSKSDSPDALKDALKGLVEHIRFPIMSTSEVATKVVPTGLLTSSQVLALFTYVSTAESKEKSGGEKPKLPTDLKMFSNVKRKSGEAKFISYEYSGQYSSAGTQNVEHLNDWNDRSLQRGICANSPGWINLELQEKITIHEVEIGGWNGNTSLWGVTNGGGATISTSNDKSSWQQVGSIPTSFGATISKVTLTKTEAKWIRFQHTSYLGIGYCKILPEE